MRKINRIRIENLVFITRIIICKQYLNVTILFIYFLEIISKICLNDIYFRIIMFSENFIYV